MYSATRAAGAGARVAAIWLLTLMFWIAPQPVALAAKSAVTSAAPTGDETASPKIHEFLTLLADPKVQEWLEKQGTAKTAAGSASDSAEISVSHELDTHLTAVREHMVALAAALPDLPLQFERASSRVNAELGQGGRARALLLLVGFVGLGFGVEWLFRKAIQGVRAKVDALPTQTIGDRLRIVGARIGFALGVLAAFAIGSVGAFLAFDWTPLLREIVAGYLVAALAIRATMVVSRLLLAPKAERYRVVPMERAAAWFWYRRFTAFVGVFAFGWVLFGLGATLGYSLEARQIVAYALGLILLAIALEAVWHRPPAPAELVEPSSERKHYRLGHGARNVLLSIGIVLLWVLWVLHAMMSFWFVLVAIALPLAISITRRAVEHLLRPPDSAEATAGPPTVLTICLERGIRAVLIIGAVAVLAWGWGVDLAHLHSEDTWLGRLTEGVLSAIVILLLADFLWQAMKTAIDRKLAEAADRGPPSTDEARRAARLRTLLPIFRNILFVVVVVVAALMALAAMGVQIGPLIAGAGVVGVAVGFGAQTFVRDVIAGMFYLMDDAFRVGEYIQAGNYKGTVESFSIRSVRLRHHRGPVYTVPFSLLGAVQNQSRDWVIDKIAIGVTYDSDLEKARKLIKQIGLELQKDPEFAPLIIEPLKMQGVENLGDFAVQIRAKMMTLPGEQFVIRRKAYAMIKKAFDENGIKFAFPTVQVAGEAEAPGTSAAIAQRGLELTHPAAAAAA
jgi:moderate conductance mechanosensitive channel